MSGWEWDDCCSRGLYLCTNIETPRSFDGGLRGDWLLPTVSFFQHACLAGQSLQETVETFLIYSLTRENWRPCFISAGMGNCGLLAKAGRDKALIWVSWQLECHECLETYLVAAVSEWTTSLQCHHSCVHREEEEDDIRGQSMLGHELPWRGWWVSTPRHWWAQTSIAGNWDFSWWAEHCKLWASQHREWDPDGPAAVGTT